MLETAEKLGAVARRGVATGGSATTLVDSVLDEPDDYLTGGTLWFLSGDHVGLSAAVTIWVNSSHTFTFADPGLGALAEGVFYAAAHCDYPRWLLIASVNAAMREIGKQVTEDISTTTVSNQMTYTLPSGINGANLKRVEIGINSTSPVQYYLHCFWRVVNDTLIFQAGSEPDGGYTMKLTYEAYPAEMDADTDELANGYDAQRVAWEAACAALRYRIAKTGGQDRLLAAMLVDAEQKSAEMGRRYPMRRMMRTPEFHYWGGG